MKYAIAILAFASVINSGSAINIGAFEEPKKEEKAPPAKEGDKGGNAAPKGSDTSEILPASVDSKSEEWVHKMPEAIVAGNSTKSPVIQPDNTEPFREAEPPKTEAQKKAEQVPTHESEKERIAAWHRK